MAMDTTPDGASRRDLLRGGAIGVGALVGGVMAAPAISEAAAPGVKLAAASGPGQHFWLAIAGITGAGTAKGFEKQIAVSSFSWGVSVALAAVGQPQGRPTATDFSFQALSSKATPQLLLNAVSGKVAQTAVLTGVRTTARGVAQNYLKITLTHVLVSSLEQGESGGGQPQDAVSLNYQKVTLLLDGVTTTFNFAPSPG
jgi:type VI secretion system Hcp family effector